MRSIDEIRAEIDRLERYRATLSTWWHRCYDAGHYSERYARAIRLINKRIFRLASSMAAPYPEAGRKEL